MEKNATNYKYFRNDKCEFFPCHNIGEIDKFNCLFCYCPLYVLDNKCGGNFKYLLNGIKDCSSCIIPHTYEGYDHIIQTLPKIKNIMDMSNILDW